MFLTRCRDFFVYCNAFRTTVVWAGDCIYMNWRFTTLDLTVKTRNFESLSMKAIVNATLDMNSQLVSLFVMMLLDISYSA